MSGLDIFIIVYAYFLVAVVVLTCLDVENERPPTYPLNRLPRFDDPKDF